MKYALFIILICMASCKAQKESQLQADPDIVLIAQDGFSGIQEYEASAIKDGKALKKFYSRINKTRKPGLPVPIVDFSKEMLIVLCMGEQNGENVPVIARSGESESELSLAVGLSLESEEKKEEQTKMSYPFYLYKMPYSTKKVAIQKQGW